MVDWTPSGSSTEPPGSSHILLPGWFWSWSGFRTFFFTVLRSSSRMFDFGDQMMDPVLPPRDSHWMEPRTSLPVTLLVLTALISMVTPSSPGAGVFSFTF